LRPLARSGRALLQSFSVEDLERRTAAFQGMWRDMQPLIEHEVGMRFDTMVERV
jgi:hypothetical protein